ncbi:DUF3237 domain-containing protein [Pseudomonas eucalypticola]|uniref:UPF0311 protein HWQ56_13055 n=2 Tax=Pseudomonas TaxID=286 RepID=A0A7D5DC05_9PSED|nr:DUF3237 domain-containing protein [Pseudomonas eucalypticola]
MGELIWLILLTSFSVKPIPLQTQKDVPMRRTALLLTLTCMLPAGWTEAAPALEPVYEATIDIAPGQALGKGPLGERFKVPITGGEFHGPGLQGKVLAGGADRQLLRADGVKQLDALYDMQTEDGTVLTVRNQVLVHGSDGGRYAFSTLTIQAPEGPYAWLNKAVYVGSLTSLKPQREAVLVKVYRVQ